MDEWRPVVPADEMLEVDLAEARSSRFTKRVRHVTEVFRWMGPARLFTAVVTVPLLVVGAYMLVRTPADPVETDIAYATTSSPPQEVATMSQMQASAPDITVHVAGHVHSPGVYVLTTGQRIVDAIRAAGGAQPIADLDSINLALVVNDGDQIYVPAVGEVNLVSGVGRVGVGSSEGETGFPIDINTATATDLDRLPGIGPSTSAAIVGHREKFGPFSSPSGLLEVPGIGPSKFEAIKDLVTT